MAISKVFINKDRQALTDFLNASGLFGEVTLSNSNINCYDADNNLLAVITIPAVTLYWNETDSFTITLGNQNGVDYAYACANGVMLSVKTGNYWAYIMISKTNNDRVAFIVSYTSGNGASDLTPVTKLFAVAWGDQGGPTVSNDFRFTPNVREQTVLVPFTTYSAYGVLSYTPKAGYFPVSQNYNTGDGRILLDGKSYISNGYWAIRDEEAE